MRSLSMRHELGVNMPSALAKPTLRFLEKRLMFFASGGVGIGCELVGHLPGEPQCSGRAVIQNQSAKTDPGSQFVEVHAVPTEGLPP